MALALTLFYWLLNLLEADVALADGSFVTASQNQHPGLFWPLAEEVVTLRLTSCSRRILSALFTLDRSSGRLPTPRR
jgi:hypothetical protein